MAQPNTPTATSGVFINTISRMSGGRTLVKIEDALREATRAARLSAGKAKVTIELTVAPGGLGVGDEPLFKVSGKVKKTLPEVPETASNFFVDDDDNLTPRNPRQEEMRLTAIDGGRRPSVAELREDAHIASNQ